MSIRPTLAPSGPGGRIGRQRARWPGRMALVCALALGVVHSAAARAEPPNRTETTRCLAEALSAGLSPVRCLELLRAPCASAPEMAACIDRLIDAHARHAEWLITARAPMTPPATTEALARLLASARSGAAAQCADALADTDRAPRAGAAQTAPAECRLLMVALMGHMIEFHPRRLVSPGPEES
ncbi:MAG: hypothetical protein AAGC57_13560 [Pseudomonadota bacterium]